MGDKNSLLEKHRKEELSHCIFRLWTRKLLAIQRACTVLWKYWVVLVYPVGQMGLKMSKVLTISIAENSAGSYSTTCYS